jgi:hypothetical protein
MARHQNVSDVDSLLGGAGVALAARALSTASRVNVSASVVVVLLFLVPRPFQELHEPETPPRHGNRDLIASLLGLFDQLLAWDLVHKPSLKIRSSNHLSNGILYPYS